MKRTLFETPDLSVDDVIFSDNGHNIIFSAEDKGLVNLFSVPVAGGTPKLVVKGGTITQFHAGPGFIVFAKSTLTSPPDLFRINIDGTSTKRLTNENEIKFAQIAVPQYESKTVAGAGG